MQICVQTHKPLIFPVLLSGVPSVTEHVTCFGFAEGDIDFSVSATEIGAGGPYTYSIDGNNFQKL